VFKRYPYRGWLIVSILLWCITGYLHHNQQRILQPANMARAIGNDLSNREQSLTHFIHNKELIRRIYADSIADADVGTLERLPFFLFAYANDSLIYWNTNEAFADCIPAENNTSKLIRNQKGVFLQKCVALQGNNKLTVLFPILITYPRENDYLRSHFLADDHIPVSSQITGSRSVESIAVYASGALPECYLLVHKEDIQHNIPDNLIISFIIISLLASVSWVHLMMIHLAKKRSRLLAFTSTIGLIIFLRGLTYVVGLPFGLGNIKFFSPVLYASSSFLPSLGDMLLNTICLLWIVVFLVRYLPYKNPLIPINKIKLKQLAALVIIALLTSYAYSFVNTIRSLVIDSNISFDVSHFYSINIYTILGLFTIALLTAISCVIIYVINIQLNHYIKSKFLKYLFITVIGLCFSLLGISQNDIFYLFLSAWLLLFIIMLDVRGFDLVPDLFAPHMIFWAAFVCLFCTAMLQYFNHVKEKTTRKVFAEQHVMPERDPITENSFRYTTGNIKNDKSIRSFFHKPNAATRRALNEHIDAAYLGGQLNKYQARIFLFDAKGHNLFNKDTVSYNEMAEQVNEAIRTLETGLYYKSVSGNEYDYMAYMQVDDSNKHKLGYIFITLSEKRAHNETVNLELLRSTAIEPDFPHAIYENGKITSHTNDYPFPDYIKQGTYPAGEFVFVKANDASELWFSYKEKRTIVVVHNHNLFIETITLFSYLFGIEILMAVMLLAYQFYLSYFLNSDARKNSKLTLRKRIHLSMLLIVLLSFLIIGIVTIAFFTDQYKTNNKTRLETAMQTVQEAVQQYMKQNNGLHNGFSFDSVSHSTKFKYFITTLARDHVVDINIFNISGAMEEASQEEIYDRELLARLIRPDAYYQLNKLNRSLFIQNESIGKLSYLSCYVPLHDLAGTTFGYINVLNLSSEKELNFQISNIVVTLINLYAFIFLISGIITIIISRWLTGSLNIIIKQFARLNLQRNERVDWPFDDEIGMLVKEYNNMVAKLEENAALLAQSERESAWREMARQVAHEIKNPLTPMRLNIQHLQQALHNNYPNAKELAQKVSESLIEQIDNLSYIASEFSNFAKMPEARPEEVDVNIVIDTAMELYLNESGATITLKKYNEPLPVLSDKSQMMRMLTNLLENAKQAIPAGKKGHIEVTVSKEDGYAIITVSDNGEGISEEAQKKIFQPYFTTKSSGTGLGLTMTKKIIEFWKGDIWFETTEGKGTTFFIKIPLLKKP